MEEIDNSPSVLSLYYDESANVVFATGKVCVVLVFHVNFWISFLYLILNFEIKAKS